MIVYDIHVHLICLDWWNPIQVEVIREISNRELLDLATSLKTPKEYAEYLRGQGVSRAVLLAEHSPSVSLTRSEIVADFCKGEKNFFVPFCSVNPNYDSFPEIKLEHYITDLGMKGLKLLPSYDLYYPNDPRMYKVYQIAERLKIPVMFHIGSSRFKGTRMKYCDPIYLDDVAQDFPNLTIVLCHGGRGFEYQKAFFLSKLHKNIHIDISGLPPKTLLSLYPGLESNIDKFMFGSDFPSPPKGIDANIADILNLPIKDRSKEKILYRNAERVILNGT